MFHVLLALAEGERHGYAIMKEVERATRGEARLGPGTLYRTLGDLLDQNLIEPAPGAEDARRRTYRLTGRGRRVAAQEARRLARLVDLARTRRLLPRGA
jgi:DNA-binding PadR family transcriptional regulator